VVARGNEGQKIFLRESDYRAFIERLRTVRERYPLFLYAYVLMSNHFHLTPLPAGASLEFKWGRSIDPST
jgi:REP element-mobilizing transposase RayT